MSPNVVDPFDPKPTKPEGTTRELRQFSVLAGSILLAIGAVQFWRADSHESALAWCGAGVLFILVGLLFPRVVQPVFLGLMAVTMPIGHLVSTLVLGIVYFAVFTPMAVLFRLIGRDELRLKYPAGSSCWKPVEPVSDIKRYLKQF